VTKFREDWGSRNCFWRLSGRLQISSL